MFVNGRCYELDQYTIYPYADQFSNNVKFSDQIRPVSFPDSSFYELDEQLEFSMAAGNFLEIYKKASSWDSVVTCFFIDTAHNLIDYIEKVWEILKPGGYWINFGPLLYHYRNVPGEKSIELSYEQIRRVVEKIGFKYIVI